MPLMVSKPRGTGSRALPPREPLQRGLAAWLGCPAPPPTRGRTGTERVVTVSAAVPPPRDPRWAWWRWFTPSPLHLSKQHVTLLNAHQIILESACDWCKTAKRGNGVIRASEQVGLWAPSPGPSSRHSSVRVARLGTAAGACAVEVIAARRFVAASLSSGCSWYERGR